MCTVQKRLKRVTAKLCCVLQPQDLSRMRALVALALVVVAVGTAEAAT